MHLSDDQPLAPDYFASMNNLRLAVMACCAGLVVTGPVEDSYDEMVRIAQEMATEVDKRALKVRGNRSGNITMTYGDARLLLARTLEVCIERLDNPRAGS